MQEGLRPQQPCSYDHPYKIEDCMPTFGFYTLNIHDHTSQPNDMLAAFDHPLGEVFVTEQMFYRKGLKVFGKRGANAVVSEMCQLDELAPLRCASLMS
jgi:hypothetical protein